MTKILISKLSFVVTKHHTFDFMEDIIFLVTYLTDKKFYSQTHKCGARSRQT